MLQIIYTFTIFALKKALITPDYTVCTDWFKLHKTIHEDQ